jgi:hypothetical protein
MYNDSVHLWSPSIGGPQSSHWSFLNSGLSFVQNYLNIPFVTSFSRCGLFESDKMLLHLRRMTSRCFHHITHNNSHSNAVDHITLNTSLTIEVFVEPAVLVVGWAWRCKNAWLNHPVISSTLSLSMFIDWFATPCLFYRAPCKRTRTQVLKPCWVYLASLLNPHFLN